MGRNVSFPDPLLTENSSALNVFFSIQKKVIVTPIKMISFINSCLRIYMLACLKVHPAETRHGAHRQHDRLMMGDGFPVNSHATLTKFLLRPQGRPSL